MKELMENIRSHLSESFPDISIKVICEGAELDGHYFPDRIPIFDPRTINEPNIIGIISTGLEKFTGIKPKISVSSGLRMHTKFALKEGVNICVVFVDDRLYPTQEKMMGFRIYSYPAEPAYA